MHQFKQQNQGRALIGDFTANYLAELTASLTAEILKGIGRKLRDAIAGTEKEQAIARSIRIGLAALLATASAGSKDGLDQLSNIFRKFFAEPDVGKELGALLRGHPLKRDELLYLFEHAGFDATTLPGVSFERASLPLKRRWRRVALSFSLTASTKFPRKSSAPSSAMPLLPFSAAITKAVRSSPAASFLTKTPPGNCRVFRILSWRHLTKRKSSILLKRGMLN